MSVKCRHTIVNWKYDLLKMYFKYISVLDKMETDKCRTVIRKESICGTVGTWRQSAVLSSCREQC